MLRSYRRFGQLITPIVEGRAALLYPSRWDIRCPETSVANSHCTLYNISLAPRRNPDITRQILCAVESDCKNSVKKETLCCQDTE